MIVLFLQLLYLECVDPIHQLFLVEGSIFKYGQNFFRITVKELILILIGGDDLR